MNITIVNTINCNTDNYKYIPALFFKSDCMQNQENVELYTLLNSDDSISKIEVDLQNSVLQNFTVLTSRLTLQNRFTLILQTEDKTEQYVKVRLNVTRNDKSSFKVFLYVYQSGCVF